MKKLFHPRALQSLHVEKCKINLPDEGPIFDVENCKSLEFVFIAYNSGTVGLKIPADSFYYYSHFGAKQSLISPSDATEYFRIRG